VSAPQRGRRKPGRARSDRHDRVRDAVGGRRAVAEAIRAGLAREVLVADGAHETQGLRDLLEAAATAGIEVRRVARADLDAMAGDHQGVAALVRGGGRADLTERDLEDRAWGEDDIAVVLDGITDPQNLGAAARAAEVAGVAVLVSRVKRAADLTPAAVRASAGALLHLPHARVANIPRAIGRLQDAGFTAVGLDGTSPDDIYGSPCPPGRVAIVLGSEGEGISRLAKERCDVLVALPVRGKVGSLNASASLAAALYAYVIPSRLDRTGPTAVAPERAPR
jgi:23S rRNA (guanosine2251-2'-O)-methyltransferase